MTIHTGLDHPGSDNDFEAIAVSLITTFVQELFADLDPIQLVEAGAPELSDHDKHIVAKLIDGALVELEVGFDEPG